MNAFTRVALPIVAVLASACGGSTTPVATNPTAAAVSGAATPAPPTAKLIVGFSEIYEGTLPIWYAADKGIFAKNAIDADLRFIASSTGIAAILAGEIQVFQGGGSETLSANAAGSDLVLIGNLVPIYPYVFMATADIKTLNDLRGKKVGVSSPGSTSDIATRIGLTKEGIDPNKDVSIVPVGSSQARTAALRSGAIQGGLDQPPFSIQLEAEGLHPLFDMASLKLPVVNNGVIVQRTYMTANRPVIQRYMDSLVQSVASLRKDKAGAIAVMKKQLQVNDETILARTYDYAMNLFPSLPYAKADQLADSVTVLGATNEKVKSYDVKKMLDESFVKSAADRGLDKP